VKSHGGSRDVLTLGNFLISFLLDGIKVGVGDLETHLRLIERFCCINVKFDGIEL
jgi:hypothetical protein